MLKSLCSVNKSTSKSLSLSMKCKPRNRLWPRSLVWKKIPRSLTTKRISSRKKVNLRKQPCNQTLWSWKNPKIKIKCIFRHWKKESRRKTKRLNSRKISSSTCKNKILMPWINTSRIFNLRNQCLSTRLPNSRSVLRKLKTHLWLTKRNWHNKSSLRHSRTKSLPTKYRNWKIQSSYSKVNKAKRSSKWAMLRWTLRKNRRRMLTFWD